MNSIILDLEINNIKSVKKALEKFSETKTITHKDQFTSADVLILPGNGSFKKGMEEIKKRGFEEIIKDYFYNKKKIISICLGLQLMMGESEEAEGVKGLNLIEGSVIKINDKSIKLPLLGWYDVSFENDFYKNESFFFNNNYMINPKNKSLIVGKSNKIPSFVKKNNFYGFQFHPEKSGKRGIELIKKILYR
jgi:glutamine amidotransferase